MEILNVNTNISCGNCPFADDIIYRDHPDEYRCMKTGEYHIFNYKCGNIKLCYLEGDEVE